MRPKSELERVVQELDRQNPYEPGDERHVRNEIANALELSHFFTQSLCTSAYETWVQQAEYAQEHLPKGCQVTLYPPPETPPNASPKHKGPGALTKAELSLITGLSVLHILRLWHGIESPIARDFQRKIAWQLEDRMPRVSPDLFHNPLMVIAFVHSCNVDKHGVAPFAPPGMRKFLNSRWAMLSDILMVLTFLGNGKNANRILMYASRLVRSNCAFMAVLVTWLGVRALKHAHPSLIEHPTTRAYLERAYRNHAKLVARSDHRLLRRVPPFRQVVEPGVRIVDVDAWLTTG